MTSIAQSRTYATGVFSQLRQRVISTLDEIETLESNCQSNQGTQSSQGIQGNQGIQVITTGKRARVNHSVNAYDAGCIGDDDDGDGDDSEVTVNQADTGSDANVDADNDLSNDKPASGGWSVNSWNREGGGGGLSSILRGRVIEKAGVHVSEVHGPITPQLAKQLSPRRYFDNSATEFWAGGLSVIIHPRSPHLPSAHLNVRRIEAGQVWFGGGADLTPMLRLHRNANHEDSRDFYRAMETACIKHGADYEAMKQACAEYFFIPHRHCQRGVGGIFFEDFCLQTHRESLSFCEEVVQQFCLAYLQIARRSAGKGWSEDHRIEQAKFRALYAEFNLVYDRGTAFGLSSGGNVEAILSSLPPTAIWQ